MAIQYARNNARSGHLPGMLEFLVTPTFRIPPAPAASPAKRFISVLGISPDPLRLLQDFTERNGATLVAPASSPNDSLSHRVFSRLFGSSSQGS